MIFTAVAFVAVYLFITAYSFFALMKAAPIEEFGIVRCTLFAAAVSPAWPFLLVAYLMFGNQDADA